MKTAAPFIVVDNCKEKLKFYQSVLGGEIRVLRTQDERVLNAELDFGSSKIFIADTTAAKPTRKGDYAKVALKSETEEEFLRAYEGLAEGGQTVAAPYEAPFNGKLAILSDRNGIGWVLQFYRD
ncbi:VOC family protein [Cohnella caldifontis]|uniref:VOC family protein n=1 Tax=Cohnella caldifontis TaxID=3027471 RepID=UPI0023EB9A03|nr:VOC family protein [Cohnella sp. YIM B05605]